MKCNAYLLEDYVEGFLEEIERNKMEAHLHSCKNCQLEYEQLLNEQKTLIAQLNKPRMANSQADAIMQRIQTNVKHKKSWHTLKMSVISAAVIMLSFVLYSWNRTPNELAQQPFDEPTQLIETNSNVLEEHLEGEQVLDYNEPFLDVSIDKVEENGENYDIIYRVKFKENYQQEQNNLYKQFLNKYQNVEVANEPKIESTQDDFFGTVRSMVKFAIRDDKDQLILTTWKTKDDEQPLIPKYSTSGGGTETLGEMIYTTSVPKYTNPSTFEVLRMEAYVFDLFETDVNTSQLQTFQYNDVTYAIDSVEIDKGSMYVKISTEGKPETVPIYWYIEHNNRLIGLNSGDHKYIKGRSTYIYEFENFEQIPSNLKLVPAPVKKFKQIDPIVLDLH
ncbi:zf-HC2 domain-containing protein [Solibacillus sp. A46]|uniref:Zf-HC2 domain-containing protein n=1 Tax=Solibacillus faecavium TaxID=2762221 RepID=A0ABR8XW79_9BACL|nr:zf-HC2 domain-containing protein [Solibacillus faecavium]MBD8036197.1 zf-HC2 domain-containing protein [Solibacillus faecavium]